MVIISDILYIIYSTLLHLNIDYEYLNVYHDTN